MFVCVRVCVWAAVSAGLSLAVPACLTLYVIVTVLDELNEWKKITRYNELDKQPLYDTS